MNGLLYAALAGVGFGAYNFLVGRSGSAVSAPLGTFVMTLVAAGIAGLCMAVQKVSGSSIVYSRAGLFYVVGAGICAGIAEIFYFYAFSKNTSISVILPVVFTLTVAVGVVLALIFNGEALTLSRSLGLILAVAALVLLAR